MKKLLILLLVVSSIFLLSCDAKEDSKTAEPIEEKETKTELSQEEIDEITAQIKKDHSNFVEVMYVDLVPWFQITPTSLETINAFYQEDFKNTKIYKTLTEYADNLSKRLISNYNFTCAICIINPINDEPVYLALRGKGKDWEQVKKNSQ